MCWYKNAGVAGYAEAFRPVQSDSQTSEWYSYFENDVLVIGIQPCSTLSKMSAMVPWHFLLPEQCWSGLRLPEEGSGDGGGDCNGNLQGKFPGKIEDSIGLPDIPAGRKCQVLLYVGIWQIVQGTFGCRITQSIVKRIWAVGFPLISVTRWRSSGMPSRCRSMITWISGFS